MTPTRQAIAEAATDLFRNQGYAGTSVRGVAAAAGVDPALVIRHFGSKERLFLDTVDLRGHFGAATDGPIEDLGRNLVAAIVGPGREVRYAAYRSMMRASDSELVRQRLVEALEEMFVAPLTPRLEGRDPELRARLIAAQVGGLLDALTIVCDEHLLATDPAVLAATYGAAIQTLVDLH